MRRQPSGRCVYGLLPVYAGVGIKTDQGKSAMVFYHVAELRPRHVSFQRAMRSLIGIATSILRCCFSVSQEQGPVELWKYQEVERLEKKAIAQKEEAGAEDGEEKRRGNPNEASPVCTANSVSKFICKAKRMQLSEAP